MRWLGKTLPIEPGLWQQHQGHCATHPEGFPEENGSESLLF